MAPQRRDLLILEAAAKLFYDKGFDGVGVNEIGQRASVSGPAIYRHFTSKDEILIVLLETALDGIFKATGGNFDDPGEALVRRISSHVGYMLDERILNAVWQREGRRVPEQPRRRLQRRERDYFDWWVECVAKAFPQAPEDGVLPAAYGALSIMNGVAMWPSAVRRSPGLRGRVTRQVLHSLTVLGPLPDGALAAAGLETESLARS